MNAITELYLKLTGRENEENLIFNVKVLKAGNIKPVLKAFHKVFSEKEERIVKQIEEQLINTPEETEVTLLDGEELNELINFATARVLIDGSREKKDVKTSAKEINDMAMMSTFFCCWISILYFDENDIQRKQYAMVRFSKKE
jgi:hypothetical protein